MSNYLHCDYCSSKIEDFAHQPFCSQDCADKYAAKRGDSIDGGTSMRDVRKIAKRLDKSE